ncbi:hypothetical protein DMUE_0788 [Dictyocoela muelleri]|nr:hypothetical protein DMUE_0788 [Dictyocoela muelleri]
MKKYNCVLLSARIIERALLSNESGRHIVVSECSSETATVVNSRYYGDLVRSLRNRSNFTQLPESDIPVELHKTLEGKQFLHFDSGMNNLNKMLSSQRKKILSISNIPK